MSLIHDIIARARAEGRNALNEASGKALLGALGVRAPKSLIVAGADQVPAIIVGMTPPFAVKVVAREIVHKSDVGGVTLHVKDAAAAARAISDMAGKSGIAGKAAEGWLIEEMIPAGIEIVIGGLYDPQFGPMIMVGLGGIFVEVLKDVSFGFARHGGRSI